MTVITAFSRMCRYYRSLFSHISSLSLFFLVCVLPLREFIAKHSGIHILLRNALYHSDNQPSLRHLPLSCLTATAADTPYRFVQTGFIYFLCSARLKRSGQASKSCTEESACYRRIDSKNNRGLCRED